MPPVPPPPARLTRDTWADAKAGDALPDGSACSAQHAQMLRFTAGAATARPPVRKEVEAAPELRQAISWAAQRCPAEIIAAREAVTRAIECEGVELRESGAVERWFAGADAHVRRVAREVNGPLLERLARRSGFHDPGAVELFRRGAPFVGMLPCSGNGVPIAQPVAPRKRELLVDVEGRNRRVLARLRDDGKGSALLAQARKEAAETGRISVPVPVEEVDLSSVLLTPRFPVEKLKEDGSISVRAVDDCTASEANAATSQAEKLGVDGVDKLHLLAQWFVAETGELPSFFKADIDAAFRRVPLEPGQRHLCWVVFRAEGQTWCACHYAACFGAMSSVHSWDRVGSLVTHIVRWAAKVALLRYVDDKFAPERQHTVQHAMGVVARLIRALLGETAVAPKKLECGKALVILGLSVRADWRGFHCTPDEAKRRKWKAKLEEALRTGVLQPGACSKLAGALSWAAANAFHRLGRAMLRPLFCHAKGRRPGVRRELELALRWWLHVLDYDLHQERPWGEAAGDHATLIVDARSTPPRLAAVFFPPAGDVQFCDMAPGEEALRHFRRRGDGDILALELLAIALGVSTFAKQLAGGTVVVFSDNTGAERATARGSAAAWDYSAVVHCLWRFAAEHGFGMWLERVGTKDNIADLPSREDYGLLRAIGARRVEARLDVSFIRPVAWESLALLKGFCSSC